MVEVSKVVSIEVVEGLEEIVEHNQEHWSGAEK